MNSLDAISLGDLVLEEPLGGNINTEIEYASDNSVIVYEKDRKVRLLRLYGGSDWGFLTQNDMTALENLANTSQGIYTLTYNSKLYTVRFRNEEQAIRGERVNPHLPNSSFNNIELLLMEIYL